MYVITVYGISGKYRVQRRSVRLALAMFRNLSRVATRVTMERM